MLISDYFLPDYTFFFTFDQYNLSFVITLGQKVRFYSLFPR